LQNSFTGNAAAGAFNFIQQKIEGLHRLSGKAVTVSFWANASAALRLGLNIQQYFGTGGSPSATIWVLPIGQSFNVSTGWQRFTSGPITIPSIAGKTLGSNGDHSTVLSFFYSSGATSNATAGNVGVQSGAINLWGVQLEIGSIATPLEKPDPRYDLANCQRFYQTGYVAFNSYGATGNGWNASFTPAVTFRASPTCTINVQGSTSATSPSITVYGDKLVLGCTCAATGVVGINASYTASADL